MEQSNDRVFAELKSRIESENRSGRKRTFFSKSTKQEIEKMLSSGFPPAALSKRLGVSDQTLAKWRQNLNKTESKPRRLKVVNDSSEPQAASQVAAARERTDVMLPNGVVLKNLALNVQTLALLKGL